MSLLELPAAPPLTQPSLAPQRWKWTGADLLRMGETGLLPPEGRFELLDGEIYQLMPPGTLHAYIVDVVVALLGRLVSPQHFVRAQNPMRLNDVFAPQPDVALVRGRKRDYRSRFPGPDEVELLVEVCDSSITHDRDLKLPAYAAAGVRECWLVNLPEQHVEVYREPAESGYQSVQQYQSGDTIAPVAFPETSFAVATLLGEEDE